MRVIGTDIMMIRGDTEALRVSVQSANRDKLFLSEGDVVYFTVKLSPKTEDKLIQKVITEFQNGDAIIKIDPKDTKDFDFKTYYYDIQLTRKNGDVKTIVPMSRFEMEEEITFE